MSWTHNAFSQHTGISYPILQAPMAGGPGSPNLVAAVSNHGCLGSLAAGYLKANALDSAIHAIKKATSKPFLTNFFIPAQASATADQMHSMLRILHPFARELGIELTLPTPPFCPSFESQMEVLLDHRLSILSFTFGLLETKWIKILKERRVMLIGTATSIEEALALEHLSIDYIVCQGKEAGGHRGSFIKDARLSTTHLLQQCLSRLKTPLIASGGIMKGEDIAQALKLGASAVQMGSVFLTTQEAGTHPLYKKTILNLKEGGTTLTRAFTGKYARGVRNRFIDEMLSHEHAILDYPIQHAFTAPLRTAAYEHQRSEFLALWAGERAFLCQELPVATLLETLIQACSKVF